MRTIVKVLLPVGLLVSAGCGATRVVAVMPGPPRAAGLAYAMSNAAVAETFDRVGAALQRIQAMSIVARVDHAANATSVAMMLRPTRVILFGNPSLGTPLMQRNQAAGIDLPQSVVIYENAAREVFAGYNTVDYLSSRHGVDGVATLPMLATGLKSILENATASTVCLPEPATVPSGAGLIIRQSSFSVDETFARLTSAVMANSALRVVTEVNHAAAAARVGLSLRPTRLLVFENARLGTPLLQSQQSIGIDLPQRILVWQDATGAVNLAYNDPAYLANRHDIQDRAQEIQMIAAGLAALAKQGTTP